MRTDQSWPVGSGLFAQVVGGFFGLGLQLLPFFLSLLAKLFALGFGLI